VTTSYSHLHLIEHHALWYWCHAVIHICFVHVYQNMWVQDGKELLINNTRTSEAKLSSIAGHRIEETIAGIGIPASQILVWYRTKKMPDCVRLVRYRTCSGIVSFFQSGTGLTGCRTVRHSGISKYLYMDIEIDMQH
jgi:hypothetical protein